MMDLITEAADYRQLRDCLEEKDWRSADIETRKIVLGMARELRKNEEVNNRDTKWLQTLSYLRTEDIKQFPVSDLQIVDRLWTEFSKEHFGLTAQVRVWQNLASYNITQRYGLFADAVGWCWPDTAEWRKYEQLDFTIDAPPGHLPARIFFTDEGLSTGWDDQIAARLADSPDSQGKCSGGIDPPEQD